MVGSLVWIEDPDEAWLDGEVVEIKVLCTSGKIVSVLSIIFSFWKFSSYMSCLLSSAFQCVIYYLFVMFILFTLFYM